MHGGKGNSEITFHISVPMILLFLYLLKCIERKIDHFVLHLSFIFYACTKFMVA